MPHILEALIVSKEEKTDDDIKSQVGARHAFVTLGSIRKGRNISLMTKLNWDKYKPNPPLLVRLTDREQLSRVYIKFSEYDGPRIY